MTLSLPHGYIMPKARLFQMRTGKYLLETSGIFRKFRDIWRLLTLGFYKMTVGMVDNGIALGFYDFFAVKSCFVFSFLSPDLK